MRTKHQLQIPPMEVQKTEQLAPPFRKTEREKTVAAATVPAFRNMESPLEAFRIPEPLDADAAALVASELFDAACTQSGLITKEIAALCGVSESLVWKWRSSEARVCPSFAQLLMLPFRFHLSLIRAWNKRFGFARALLSRVVNDLGLAMAVGE